MEISQLRYLDMLVSLKSFKKAAEQCFVSTSTLSRTVSSMEEELGFPLFTRTPQGILLTEQGRVFYTQTRKILSIYDNSVANARNAAGHSRTIRVEIFSYNRNQITGVCEAAHRDDDSLHFSFVSCRLMESCAELLNHRLDVSLLTDIEGADDRLYVLPIYLAKQAVVVPRQHPLAARGHLSLEELDGETILIATPGREHRQGPSKMDFFRKHCPDSALLPFQHPNQADALCQMNGYVISTLSILEPGEGFQMVLLDDAPPVKIGAMCRREDQLLYQGLMVFGRDYFLRCADWEKVVLAVP